MKELVEIKFKEICAEYIVKNLVNYNWEYTDGNMPYIKEKYNKKEREIQRFILIYTNKETEINHLFWIDFVSEALKNKEENDLQSLVSLIKDYNEYNLYYKMKQIIDLEAYSNYRELLDDKENIFTIFDFNFLPCQKIEKYYGINFNGWS